MPVRREELPRDDAGAARLTATERPTESGLAARPAGPTPFDMVDTLDAHWRTRALAERLAATWRDARAAPPPPVEVLALAEVDSTNTRLLEAARTDATPRLRLMVAQAQTSGRGRQGRAWHAHPGASLAFSLAVPLPTSSSLSLVVGTAAAEALEPRAPGNTGPRVMLKWPNDLWLRDETAAMGGRKLGGILLEATSGVVVAGLGLNLRWFAISPSSEQPTYGVAALDELEPGADAVEVLHRLAGAVLGAMLAAATDDAWRGAWSRRDHLFGRRVRAAAVRADAAAIIGTARGIRHDGALLIQPDDGGEMIAVSSGEVSLRPLGDP